MKIAFTGHRPHKLGGYDNTNNKSVAIKNSIYEIVKSLRNTGDCVEFITGMALGVDMWAAELALSIKVPYHAYVPFKGQESKWPENSQNHYRVLIGHASSVTYVCPPGYAAWKMQRRNEAMVDDCDMLIAVWDGSSGGTANCVRYAESKKRKIIRITP